MESAQFRFATVFLGSTCLLFSLIESTALAAPDCTERWQQLTLNKKVFQSFDFSKPLYTSDDKIKIEQIWHSSATSQEKADQVFAVYKETRIRSLPLEVRKFVENVAVRSSTVKKRTVAQGLREFAAMSHGPAAYSETDRRIIVREYPAEADVQMFVAFLKAHEMEHAIQHGLALHYANAAFYQKGNRATNRDFEKIVFMAEASAMAAESEFLRGLPDGEQFIENIILELAKKQNLSSEEYMGKVSKEGFNDANFDRGSLGLLVLAALGLDGTADAKGYLKVQWGRAGFPMDRYNLKNIRQYRQTRLEVDLLVEENEKSQPIFGQILKAVGALTLGSAGYAWGCAWLKENRPDLLEKYCIGSFGQPSKSAAELEKNVGGKP